MEVIRTPVGEAIGQLELEGLVHSIPNKETVVVGGTEEDVEDIFLLRSRLEGLAARYAAERIEAKELEEMEEVLALTEFYISRKDIEQLKSLDHKFHEIMYKGTKSKILQHVLGDFHDYIQQARKTSIAMPGRCERLLEEHRAIYHAIERKDADEAEVLLNKHIQNAVANMHLDYVEE